MLQLLTQGMNLLTIFKYGGVGFAWINGQSKKVCWINLGRFLFFVRSEKKKESPRAREKEQLKSTDFINQMV